MRNHPLLWRWCGASSPITRRRFWGELTSGSRLGAEKVKFSEMVLGGVLPAKMVENQTHPIATTTSRGVRGHSQDAACKFWWSELKNGRRGNLQKKVQKLGGYTPLFSRNFLEVPTFSVFTRSLPNFAGCLLVMSLDVSARWHRGWLSLIFDHFGWGDPSQNHLPEFYLFSSKSRPPPPITTKSCPEGPP